MANDAFAQCFLSAFFEVFLFALNNKSLRKKRKENCMFRTAQFFPLLLNSALPYIEIVHTSPRYVCFSLSLSPFVKYINFSF